jgi:hypothetical protein
MNRFVYFIRPVAQPCGPVKIGCSGVPKARLQNLMDWSPSPLEIILTVPGDFRLEARIHSHFAEWRQHREWFSWSPEIASFIARLQAGTPIEEAANWSARPTVKRPRPGWTEEHSIRRSYCSRIGQAERRLRRVKGHWNVIPEDVDAIIGRWQGRNRTECIRPTAVEFQRLEQFIAGSFIAADFIPVEERAA